LRAVRVYVLGVKPGLIEPRYDQAIADYTKAIELKPDFADAFVNRGNIYGLNGLYDQAISDSTKVIQLKPNDAIGYNNRAWNYHLAGRDAEGLPDAN
jgi:tetratricopeptide (TPR) repeat protein